MAKTAVQESRTFTVQCARGITEECDTTRTLTREEDGTASLGQAEAWFRDKGWRLHSDGRASCPQCLSAWEG